MEEQGMVESWTARQNSGIKIWIQSVSVKSSDAQPRPETVCCWVVHSSATLLRTRGSTLNFQCLMLYEPFPCLFYIISLSPAEQHHTQKLFSVISPLFITRCF